MKNLIQVKHKIIQEVILEQQVLIAVHRGSAGGNIIQNTVGSFIAAMRQGANIVECDVSRTIDGELLVFHDGLERLILGIDTNIQNLTHAEVQQLSYYNSNNCKTNQRVQSLSTVLSALKGSVLINIDRGWNHWSQIIEIIELHDMSEQIILKSPPETRLLKQLADFDRKYLYMPMVRSHEDIYRALEYDINILGFEIIFSSEDDAIADKKLIANLKSQDYLVWGNSIKLNDADFLSATFDDDVSILGRPEDGWGHLLDLGFNVIQTDWPGLLHDYITEYQKKLLTKM